MKAWFWAAQRCDFLYVLRSLSVLRWGGDGVFCAGLVRVCRACMIPLFFPVVLSFCSSVAVWELFQIGWEKK